ncbi:TerD family protein [Helicobacter ailurogastricus]|uniref:Tellurium resistance protein TerD n=1 Tax=Helicobacter ailurogastricus TaxID=1578720 RepID=A0A0K2XBN5_9HELI|nr:TerD family protein [Helicobacter ailurogastricus]CRF41054.1 Tellurium resistance protein TerD [Helicobacter ailurogastricus]CRF42342.1 Tellurium resistance protein TerD [Helicobacter ailurogastricus]CRF44760.1 Tellurium resistance protein TerD [Helicobacter ailurogastricus]CRF51971.1 Tellurium resistance protein TerD [Helicobacter ailurogastricus]BDQ29083.1 stress response protein SCP2 [Helicobacter ailurogastricus]
MAVSLVKGQKISLQKESGEKLSAFCVGANWGAISKKGWFGKSKAEAVDLDLSVGLFAEQKLVDCVYFGKQAASGIKHSGDDRTGDVGGDDGLDNEVISIALDSLQPEITQLVFMLNSYTHIKFDQIPFASIRLYEGTPSQVKSVFATYNAANDSTFAGKEAMILGKLYKHNGEWKFSAIGEPTADSKLEDLLLKSVPKYL